MPERNGGEAKKTCAKQEAHDRGRRVRPRGDGAYPRGKHGRRSTKQAIAIAFPSRRAACRSNRRQGTGKGRTRSSPGARMSRAREEKAPAAVGAADGGPRRAEARGRKPLRASALHPGEATAQARRTAQASAQHAGAGRRASAHAGAQEEHAKRSARGPSQSPAGRAEVTEHSDALDLEAVLHARPPAIALSLKRSRIAALGARRNRSARPCRLNVLQTAGRNLSGREEARAHKAKDELRKLYGVSPTKRIHDRAASNRAQA